MSVSVKSIYDWYRNTLRNPKYRWWVILGSVVYILSPFDIAPDFIPLVGQVDDFMILTLLLTEVSQIVLEFARNRQPGTVNTSSATEAEATVDVNAVPVEES
ncbi:MAG: DUF1232 domain-containing protein [Spirulina sp. SIO3F2]|nr:DUF1232 domain-containing protein [Spirulina sp. SIO3F2]